MATSDLCIYTIVQGDTLADAERHGGPATYTENRRWVTGLDIWLQAQNEGKKMPVVFGDASDCSRLIYWGVLTDVSVEEDRPTYTFERVTRLSGEYRPQDLVLLSTGNTIAPDFIRPYAICYTPGFVAA